MYTFLAYVGFGDIVHYLADGWKISNSLETCHHGHYGVLMSIESADEVTDPPTVIEKKQKLNKVFDDHS